MSPTKANQIIMSASKIVRWTQEPMRKIEALKCLTGKAPWKMDEFGKLTIY